MHPDDLARRVAPMIDRLWPDEDPIVRRVKGRQLTDHIATITHNFREDYGVCHCGKEYPIWVDDESPEIADLRLQMAKNPHMDGCRKCVAEVTVRMFKTMDKCPEGDCMLTYAHTGRCQPFHLTEDYKRMCAELSKRAKDAVSPTDETEGPTAPTHPKKDEQ